MTHQGACILDAEGLRLSADEKALFRRVEPFGFILFARNIQAPDQVRALCDEMRSAVGRDVPIFNDQEGGRVQRLRAPVWREWLPPLEHVTAAGALAERAMYLRYRIIADELRKIGIDGNCAPLVDVAGPQTHEFLRNRCYETQADKVAHLGRAVANGLLDGGVLPVVKHIPGHGRAVTDSHHSLPHVDAAEATLKDVDFKPFRMLQDLPMAMTAHVVYSDLDDRAATVSPIVMQMIREKIGFEGLVMTDDVSMKALSGSLAEISVQSLEAGCDVILHCNGTLSERAEVADAAGRLSNAGQDRADRAMAMRHSPDKVDIAAMEAELSKILNGPGHG